MWEDVEVRSMYASADVPYLVLTFNYQITNLPNSQILGENEDLAPTLKKQNPRYRTQRFLRPRPYLPNFLTRKD